MPHRLPGPVPPSRRIGLRAPRGPQACGPLPAHPKASHQFAPPSSFQTQSRKCCKEARAPCLQRPHPPPPRPRQLGRRSLMWPLVPELSHRNVTQRPEEPREGREKHSWTHRHVSHAPGQLQTPFCTEVGHKWRRKTNQGKVETRALVEPRPQRGSQHSPEPPTGVGVEPAAACTGLQHPGLPCPRVGLRGGWWGPKEEVDRPGPWAEEHKALWREGGHGGLGQRQRCFQLCCWEQRVFS